MIAMFIKVPGHEVTLKPAPVTLNPSVRQYITPAIMALSNQSTILVNTHEYLRVRKKLAPSRYMLCMARNDRMILDQCSNFVMDEKAVVLYA